MRVHGWAIVPTTASFQPPKPGNHRLRTVRNLHKVRTEASEWLLILSGSVCYVSYMYLSLCTNTRWQSSPKNVAITSNTTCPVVVMFIRIQAMMIVMRMLQQLTLRILRDVGEVLATFTSFLRSLCALLTTRSLIYYVAYCIVTVASYSDPGISTNTAKNDSMYRENYANRGMCFE